MEPIVENFDTKKTFYTNNQQGYNQQGYNQQDIPPGLIPLYNADDNFLNTIVPYNIIPSQPSIHKTYNISLSDPLGNHSYINKIYEDVLPGDQTNYSFIKINERCSVKNFMRNSILDKYDGEEVTLKGGKKCLLSWIKTIDLNPYQIKQNKYEDLAFNFIIYRSAYPIRYEKSSNGLKTTPTSLAFNLRIYKLTIGALDIFNNNNNNIVGNKNEYHHVWRDIEYYRWVDTVIKRKISPNFLNLILYVQDEKSKVGFNEIDIIKKNKNPTGYNLQKENIKNIYNEIVQNARTASTASTASGTTPTPPTPGTITTTTTTTGTAGTTKTTTTTTGTTKTTKVEKNLTVDDLMKDSNKILIALTEAPNTNILKWNSKVYHSYGTLETMIATGYHKPEVWNSILFQLVYACAVMEKEEMYFNNFSLENNVFIKDIQTDGTGNSCWVYKVDNIEYFIPNYGYVLVIDSKYADIKEQPNINKQYKIYPKSITEIQEDKKFIKDVLKKQITDVLLNLEETIKANPNSNILDDTIIKKMNLIKDRLNNVLLVPVPVHVPVPVPVPVPDNKTISTIILKCFPEFINSKVGKILTKLEKENLSKNIFNRVINKGSILVREFHTDYYDWVLYKNDTVYDDDIRKNLNSGRDIMYKDMGSDTLKHGTCQKSKLFIYPEIVLPEDKTIIETYTF